MLSSMPQAATDALYEARQQRRKQLLKEQMAKKLWEDNYEGKIKRLDRLTFDDLRGIVKYKTLLTKTALMYYLNGIGLSF